MTAHGSLGKKGGQGHVNRNVLNRHCDIKVSIKKHESMQDFKDTSIPRQGNRTKPKDNDLTPE